MSFANKLNVPVTLLTMKQFTWRGLQFKVHVPSKSQAEIMNEQAKIVDEVKLQTEYERLVSTVEAGVDVRIEGEGANNDTIILLPQEDGTTKEVSLKKMAKELLVRDNTLVAFANLLHKADPSAVITIEDLDEDLSKNDQLELLEKISAVISGKDGDDEKN